MKRYSSILACAFTAFSLALAAPASAQDGEFDLASQRGEVQEFNKVPGQKIDHHGLVINPTPQSIERPYTGVLNISGGFKVNDRQKKFAGDLGFLPANLGDGLPLIIDFGPKQAKKAGVKPVDGAYKLDIGTNKVTITGYNERGAFYGLQTLRQILESDMVKAEGGLPMMVINDFPSMKYRGVVEGFYGTPWSHKVRMSLIDFYGQNKMNDYLYGPKDDPYHSSPYWRQPYPEDQARNIRELVEAAGRNRVNFIWAIHPGKDIRWNKEDYDSLVNKFNMMYDLGVRSFAIFFDDIEGEGTNPVKQAQLLNDLTRDFVKAKGDVTNLMVCPTDYSQLWAKPGPEGPLAIYGRDLNKDVEVFWTGAVVCSDLTPETLEFIDSRIKRPALYWWNYPVTDYCRHILLQGPVYGLDTTLTPDQVAGIESNPMEHGEASKLALYGVADYAWNTPAYNPIDNWERGIRHMMPEAAEAYRTFAIHSTDTETGYRRDESWETEIFPFDNYTPAQFDALKKQFEDIVTVEDRIRKGCTNPGLLAELSPWLTQFTALGQRGLRTLDLIKTYESGNNAEFWKKYVANLMTDEEKQAYEAHKIGTMKLHPFYEKSMDDMLVAYTKKLTGVKPPLFKGVGTYNNLRTTQTKLMLDGDSTTFYTSAYSQGPGDWIGLDMLETRPVYEVDVLQGRNSVSDGDYFNHVRLEYSPDGRTWIPLTGDLRKAYHINWKGEPVNARYLRLLRLDNDSKSWAAVREFTVNPPSAERIGLFDLAWQKPEGDYYLRMFDSNPSTGFVPSQAVPFERDAKADEVIVLTADGGSPVTLTLMGADGKAMKMMELTEPFTSITLEPAVKSMIVSGGKTVYEIIQR